MTVLDRLLNRYLGGHLSLGPVTLYGHNAMRYAITVWCRPLGLYLCARPSTPHRGWYFFASPNATPCAALVAFGPGIESYERERVLARWQQFRHLMQDQKWSECAWWARYRPDEPAPEGTEP